MEDYLRERGLDGLNIDDCNNILLPLIVILSYSESNRKFRTLSVYTKLNKLTVSASKTKLLILVWAPGSGFLAPHLYLLKYPQPQ